MNATSLKDPRAMDLLSRVGDDISVLRDDMRHLLSHTARHTLAGGAREIVYSARSGLAAGRQNGMARLRDLREHPNQPATWVGGAVVMGLIAAGVYWFCKDGRAEADHTAD
ncbi:MAG: hypothetical protein ACO3JG_04975 [Luteolibacter sp.]